MINFTAEDFDELMDEFNIGVDFQLCDGYLPDVVEALMREVLTLRSRQS